MTLLKIMDGVRKMLIEILYFATQKRCPGYERKLDLMMQLHI